MSRGAIVAMLLAVVGVGCSGSSNGQQDGSTGGSRLIGQPCEVNGQCWSNQCLTDAFLLGLLKRDGGINTYGGYCFLFPCMNDQECGENGHCFDGHAYGVPTSVCLKLCETAADCTDLEGQPRANYECVRDVVPDSGATPLSGCGPIGLIEAAQSDGGVVTPAEDAGTD
jgi:hypothetical protein